jgi:hypothetical protein
MLVPLQIIGVVNKVRILDQITANIVVFIKVSVEIARLGSGDVVFVSLRTADLGRSNQKPCQD